MAYARVNVDFPVAFGADPARPERVSDHDPVVAYFACPTPSTRIIGLSGDLAFGNVTVGTTATRTLTITNTGNSALAVTGNITELRARIDDLRVRDGLAAYAWNDAVLVPGVTLVRAVHLSELRIALEQVYMKENLAPPTFSGAGIVPGFTRIAATHIAELRSAVRAIW